MSELHIFKLPIVSREFHLTPEGTSKLKAVINGRGLCIKYDSFTYKSEHDVISAGIKSSNNSLIGLNYHDYAYIDALSVADALQIFYSQWHGASFFEFNNTNNALWINPARSIIELPSCKRMFVNPTTERFVCGEPEDIFLINDAYCGCVIDNYDPPSDCPLQGYAPKNEALIITHQGVELLFNPLER